MLYNGRRGLEGLEVCDPHIQEVVRSVVSHQPFAHVTRSSLAGDATSGLSQVFELSAFNPKLLAVSGDRKLACLVSDGLDCKPLTVASTLQLTGFKFTLL